MAAPDFIAWSGLTTDLTAPVASVATAAVQGTPKTILQVHPGPNKIRVIEWGYLLAAAPPAPLTIELVETGNVFATVTAGNITNYNDTTGPVSQGVLGTSATGFNASAEGTITASRLLAMTQETGMYFKQQFPLGREPEVNAGYALRLRATPGSAVAVNMWAYIIWEE